MFTYGHDLFQREGERLVVMELVAGEHFFLLERTADNRLSYFHSSPGTGTRVARVDIDPLRGASIVDYCLVWAPHLTRLTVADKERPGVEVTAEGESSMRQYRIGPDGSVFQIGDDGVQTISYSFFEGGKPAIEYTAIEAWRETAESVAILLSGASEGERDFAIVQGNACLVMLVTGFENYGRRRLLELEGEGIAADFEALVRKTLSNREREAGEVEVILAEAAEAGLTPLRVLVDQGRINFQDYDRSKTAFSRAFGLKFGELPAVTSNDLQTVQQTIRHRHRIVHGSPRTVWLNQPWASTEKEVMAGPATARDACAAFKALIEGLHTASLQLRPDAPGAPPLIKKVEPSSGDKGGAT